MSWVAVGVGVAVTAASAGSAAAGAAASGGSNSKVWDTLTQFAAIPGADPLQAAASFDVLVQLGTVDPAVLSAGSPLGRAFSIAIQQPQKLKNVIWGTFPQYQRLLQAIESGDETALQSGDLQGMLAQFGSFVGMTPNQILAAQRDFQQQLSAKIAAAGPVAADVAQSRIVLVERLAQLARDIPDIDALRDTAAQGLTTEINRIADLQSGDILRSAAAANFNPGRVLGEVERLRGQSLQQVDLDALERASGILTLQARQGALLQGLLNPATGQAFQLGAQRVSGQPTSASVLAAAQAAGPRPGLAALSAGLGSIGTLGSLFLGAGGTGGTAPGTGTP